MSTADLLRVISIVGAWSRGDAQAVEVLIQDQGPELFADLLEFVVMVIDHNTEGQAGLFLEWMSGQALAIQAQEAKR